jgi:hypothetical protein
MNKVNKLNSLGVWLQFTYGAEEISFPNDGANCTFKYKDEIRNLPIQYFDIESDGFIFNKSTFDVDSIIQITQSYLAIINVELLRKSLATHRKHVVKRDDGLMEAPRELVTDIIRIIFYEPLDGIQKNKD